MAKRRVSFFFALVAGVVVWAAVPARCVAASPAKPSINPIAFIAFIMDSPWSLTSYGSVFQISGVITEFVRRVLSTLQARLPPLRCPSSLVR
jgi:hypothetical protein